MTCGTGGSSGTHGSSGRERASAGPLHRGVRGQAGRTADGQQPRADRQRPRSTCRRVTSGTPMTTRQTPWGTSARCAAAVFMPETLTLVL
ncbi:hypothetical protein STXM2123_1459 [Streptomyces sp. F-3]|nr:hypothetical protein STXM2123_1459 [Streptomyces sp. F-3]